jgi:hypothetical protein
MYMQRRRSHNDIMFEKARYLIDSRRVEYLSTGVYNVIGEHGTYTVAVNFEGKISCNCQGFLNKGKCSHSAAVELMTAHKRHGQR